MWLELWNDMQEEWILFLVPQTLKYVKSVNEVNYIILVQ
jgi:hypothetical protein